MTPAARRGFCWYTRIHQTGERVGTGGRTCSFPDEPHLEHVTGMGSRRDP